MNNRYFQVGFNRCGTSSLADLLERGGYRTIHHTFKRNGENVNLALAIERNIAEGRLPLDGFDGVDAFTDAEYVGADRVLEGNSFYKKIADLYPEIKFVLNIRRKDDWVQSRLRKDDYATRFASALDVDIDALPAIWFKTWDTHISEVLATIPEERMLVLDIDNPDNAAISTFFNLNSAIVFPRRNKTVTGNISKFFANWLPKWLVKLIPLQAKNWMKDY